MTFYDTAATARKLTIRHDEAYKLLQRGKLEGAVKVDGRWQVPESAIEKRLAYVAACRHRSRKSSLTNETSHPLSTNGSQTNEKDAISHEYSTAKSRQSQQ
jgi:hypothetical protein